MQKMYLFITITKRADSDEFTNFFNANEISVIYSTPCKGTAREKTLALFGIEQSLKTVHYCIVTENKKNELIKNLTKDMAIDLPDRGIAVAVPMTSFGGRRALEAFAQGHENDEVIEVNKMNRKDMELIVVICEKGHTDDVMDAARAAGAGGGTVVHAKGTGSKYTDKFFGMSIADEKEMIYIVSASETKKQIMTSIMEQAGPATKAHAITFSLPVSDTAGLRFFEAE